MNQVLKFYKESSKNRTSSKTVRNERSSRSHAILRLEMNGHVENIEGMKDTCSGKVNFWFYRTQLFKQCAYPGTGIYNK